MRYVLAIGCLALSACVSQSGGNPEAVLLDRDRVTVRMSTGWPCVGFRTDETRTAEGWSGLLEGCPDPYPYRVTLKRGATPRQMALERVTAEPADDVPRALVRITGRGGAMHLFRSPGP